MNSNAILKFQPACNESFYPNFTYRFINFIVQLNQKLAIYTININLFDIAMDAETLTWLFFAGGITLMILETILPGGVALFLGISGVGVGILRFLGFLSDPVSATAVWLLSSIGLTIAIRPFIKKYFKPETFFKYADEDYEAMDQVVEVIQEINDKDNSGRIRFDGVSWNARSTEGRVEPGKKVVIRYRENTTWIVEPLEGFDPNVEKTKTPERN